MLLGSFFYLSFMNESRSAEYMLEERRQVWPKTDQYLQLNTRVSRNMIDYC